MEDKLNIDFCFVDEDKLLVEVLRLLLAGGIEEDANDDDDDDDGDAEAVFSKDTLMSFLQL